MRNHLLTVLALALGASACEPSPSAAPPPFTVMLGTRAFSGPMASFTMTNHQLVVTLAPDSSVCVPGTGACAVDLETVRITLASTTTSGVGLNPGPGEYAVVTAAAPATGRVALVSHLLPASTMPARLDEQGVSGSVTLEVVGTELVRLRLDVTLQGGRVLSGAVEARPCTAFAAMTSPLGFEQGMSPPVSPLPRKSLFITKLDPAVIFVEGGETVAMETENGCLKEHLSIRVGAVPVTQVTSPAANKYAFVAPPSPDPSRQVTVPVLIQCSAPPDPTFAYRCNTAIASLGYDPLLEPPPVIKHFTPVSSPGSASILLDSSMIVAFSRAVDKGSVNAETFRIEGVPGTHAFSDGDDTSGYRTVTFTPDAPLAPDHEYTCVVTNAVTTMAMKKPLKPGVTPLATETSDRWTFRTVCDGCAPP